MREPVADALETELVCERDKEIQEHWMNSFQKANQMFDICGNLTGQVHETCLVLKRKIDREVDEILFQIDQLNEWLEDTYNMFLWVPNNLPEAYQHLIVDWKKIYDDVGLKYGDRSFSESIMQPGESSVDAEYGELELETSPHTAECIARMIEVSSIHVHIHLIL